MENVLRFVLALVFLKSSACGQMYVETYWESWIFSNYPQDYCALLSNVPALPVGSTTGVNVVNIAFADYSGGFGGTGCDETIIIHGINVIHEAGAKAKLSFGGAGYSMAVYISTQEDANNLAQSIKYLKDTYGLDGVDFDVEDGAADAETQIMVLEAVRDACGEDFLISYTMPCLAEQYDPTMTVINEAHPILDAVNVMAYDAYWDGYSFDLDLDLLDAMGVPRNKIVWGLMPGYHDAENEYTDLDDAVNATRFARQWGLAGLMTWDINRDTDQRQEFATGEDNLYQTGLPDGTYVDTISAELNS